jgi:Tfp pilus assembly protein PilF
MVTSRTNLGRREAREAWGRAVALAPGNALALNNLAWELVQEGQTAEALAMGGRAFARAPWSAYSADTYAAALLLAGRCRDAALVQARAVDLLRDDPLLEADNREIRDRLTAYRSRCGAPAAPH